MERESMKTLLLLAVLAAVLIAATFAVRAALALQGDIQQSLAGSVSAGDNGPQSPNIRSSTPTPGSCTATQNCGSPTCGASAGGSCDCGR